MATTLGTQYAYATSGLTLYLDARVSTSYSGSGSSWYDISTTRSTGALQASPTYTSGTTNGNFAFNGSTQAVLLGEWAGWNTQAHSMECWFNPTATTQSGFLFEKGWAVNTQYSMYLESNGIFYYSTQGLSTVNLTFTTATYVTANAWNHIVCTYNGAGTKTIYVNGVQVAQATGLTGQIPTAQSTNVQSGVSIGVYGAYAGARSYWYSGKISVSRLYNTALSLTDVVRNYNADAANFSKTPTVDGITYTYEGVIVNNVAQTSAAIDQGVCISITQFSATGTYTAPTGCTRVLVQLVGAGGGASGYCESGGGGGYAEGMFPMTAGTAVTVTVGSGGTAVSYNGVGGTGGTTSFGSYLSATGGTGANSYYNHAGGYGGVGAGGQTYAQGGTGTGHANGGSHSQGADGGSSYFGGAGGKTRSNNGINFSPSPGSGASGGIAEIGTTGSTGANGLVIVYAYK
jgi:hypothetical protein